MRQIDVIKIERIDNATITCELMTINDELSEFYRLIDCDTIDIVLRAYNGRYFDIILDDNGLFKANSENQWPTSWWQGEGYTPNHEGLFGVLLLAHHDDQGNLTSVEPDDLMAVQECYKVIKTKQGEDFGILFHDIRLA